MILYNSLPDFNGNYSTSFLNLNADLTAKIAVELVTKINPEYVIISWKKDNGIFRYIYYTYEFITKINNFPPSQKNLEAIKQLKTHQNISKIMVFSKGKLVGIISFDSQRIQDNKSFLNRELNVSKGVSRGITRGIQKNKYYSAFRGEHISYAAAPPESLINSTIITRFPNAIFPNRITVDEITPLIISLKINQSSLSETGIELTAPPNEKEINVLVSIRPGNFEVIGDNYSILKVPVELKDSDSITFKIKAKEEGNLLLFI